MKLDVIKTDVWAAEVEDRAGALAEKLGALSAAGANLGFVLARRAPESPGYGVVFVTPLKGTKQIRAGMEVGFLKTESLRSVRVEGIDKPGLGGKIAEELARASINLRGFSATVIGRRFVTYLALDTAADLSKTVRTLKKIN